MPRHISKVLDEVLATRRRLIADPRQVVDKDQVLRWAKAEDLEALGALSFLLFDADESRRIEPNLSLAEYMEIELPYLERCLREDPRGEWADSRWGAGRFLANWIKDVWSDERFRPAVDRFRDWLARLLRTADQPELRTCLVQATLEHVFEIDELAERFSTWCADPELRAVYQEAKLWKQGLDELGMAPVDHRWDRHRS